MTEEQRQRRIEELIRELYSLIDAPDPDPELVDRPANFAYLHHEDDVELEGVIGRPELKTVRGKQLFTAGLKLEDDSWSNLVAWGSVAESAATIRRGAVVRVIATPKESGYVDSHGVMQTKRELTAKVISPVIPASGAISANTLSRAKRNGTT